MTVLAELSETYQAYLEQHRAASTQLDEEPWDSNLRSLVDDLDRSVQEAYFQLSRAHYEKQWA